MSERLAKILEKNTKYGSSDTEKTAGILSKAKIKSLKSMTKTVTNSGVRSHLPASLTKNLSPINLGYILPVLVKNLTSGCFSTLISSFLFLFTYILMPL